MISSPMPDRGDNSLRSHRSLPLSQIPQAIADLLVGVGYLGWARLRLTRVAPAALVRPEPAEEPKLTADHADFARRVGLAISRASSRVPWRSDCLVQALAAERWLGTAGVPTMLSLGTRKDDQSQYHFHAWLKAGSLVVTGGEIDAYAPFLGDLTGGLD